MLGSGTVKQETKKNLDGLFVSLPFFPPPQHPPHSTFFTLLYFNPMCFFGEKFWCSKIEKKTKSTTRRATDKQLILSRISPYCGYHSKILFFCFFFFFFFLCVLGGYGRFLSDSFRGKMGNGTFFYSLNLSSWFCFFFFLGC